MEEIVAEGYARLGDAGVVTIAAVKLHTYAVIVSIKDGHPGFVSDDYLTAIRVETSMTALELCLTGLWERVEGGYRVGEDETLRVARIVRRRLDELGPDGLTAA